MVFFLAHPLLWSAVTLLADTILWHLVPLQYRRARVGARLVLFLIFSALTINAGINPLRTPSPSDDSLTQAGATVLGILWWLYAARVLTEIIGLMLIRRIGHSGRLLQDVIGALVFLIAAIAASNYVLDLPVKGLLATSGVVAIVVGLALQSTLSDVFSGIVLNATKPYQVDDWVVIDGVEGKVIDIDWRATHLLTTAGNSAVVPNSIAAKAKIINFSRPNHIHGVSISIQVPTHIRPQRVLDALNRAIQGSDSLLTNPAPKAVLKEAGETMGVYVASGFIAELGKKDAIRNQLFDLAYRHMEATGISPQREGAQEAASRARALINEVKIFRSLSDDERDQIAQSMVSRQYAADQPVIALDEVPNGLMILATGVVSVKVANEEGFIEVGRMGPGEVMGEQSILADTPSQAVFTTLTSCIIYQVDKTLTRRCMEQRKEVNQALNKLQAVRQKNSHMMLMAKPVPIKKEGFLSWLRKR